MDVCWAFFDIMTDPSRPNEIRPVALEKKVIVLSNSYYGFFEWNGSIMIYIIVACENRTDEDTMKER